jgi:hypothetical protein
MSVSTMEPAAGWRFLHLPSGWVGDMEFQASDGTVLQVNPGSAMLLDDTAGKGHRSRVIGDRDALLVAVQL